MIVATPRPGSPTCQAYLANRQKGDIAAAMDNLDWLMGYVSGLAVGLNVNLLAQGDQVLIVAFKYPKTTLDDGYRQAKSVSEQWQLRTDELERWRQTVLSGRTRGVKDGDEPTFVVMAGSPLAPGGPTPYAKTLDSFDDQRPFQLDFELQWV